tara:strand:- start:5890 stop:7689 length:1800 start_codon:yes stop_codon:yes gene_type:complete
MAITLTEKRVVIKEAAETAIRDYFTEHKRLKVFMDKGQDPIKILDQATMPVIIAVEKAVPASHFDLLKSHDTNVVQKAIAHFVAKWDGAIEPRASLHHDSAPKLEGMSRVKISRRDDLKPTAHAVEACQYLSSVGLTVDQDLAAILLEYRETLDGYDPDRDTDEQENWFPRRAVEEMNRVGSSVFYTEWSLLDSRTRMYPDCLAAFHSTFCKRSRGIICGDTSWPISSAQLEQWGSDLGEDLGLDDHGMERLTQGKNPIRFLESGGDWLLFCEAKKYLQAKRTGRTDAFCYIDAAASGITLKELSTGFPNAVLNADSRHPDWNHPYARYSADLLARHEIKQAMRGYAGIPLPVLIEQVRQAMKPGIVAGGYGASGNRMAMSVLGNPVDDECPATPEEVTLALPEPFNRWVPKDPKKDWVEQFRKDFRKPFKASMNKVFPADTKLSNHLQKFWTGHVGKDYLSDPPAWVIDGFVHQPKRIRRNRDEHTALHYPCPITGKTTTIQRNVLEINRGTELLPNLTHAMDALIMQICVLLMKMEGIPVIAIHDSVGVPYPFLRRANQLYVEAVNYVMSLNVWAQFGFKGYGPIPVLDPDTGLLRR